MDNNTSNFSSHIESDSLHNHNVDTQQVNSFLKTISDSEYSSLNKDSVRESLSKFLDESNVSMMGGWT